MYSSLSVPIRVGLRFLASKPPRSTKLFVLPSSIHFIIFWFFYSSFSSSWSEFESYTHPPWCSAKFCGSSQPFLPYHCSGLWPLNLTAAAARGGGQGGDHSWAFMLFLTPYIQQCLSSKGAIDEPSWLLDTAVLMRRKQPMWWAIKLLHAGRRVINLLTWLFFFKRRK